MQQIPRHKIIRLVKSVLESEGPLTAREITKKLAKRGVLYVVVEGDREPVSVYAMKRQLNLSTEVVENDEGDWEISSFWSRNEDQTDEKGLEHSS